MFIEPQDVRLKEVTKAGDFYTFRTKKQWAFE